METERPASTDADCHASGLEAERMSLEKPWTVTRVPIDSLILITTTRVHTRAVVSGQAAHLP